jgi:hypothetical protein
VSDSLMTQAGRNFVTQGLLATFAVRMVVSAQHPSTDGTGTASVAMVMACVEVTHTIAAIAVGNFPLAEEIPAGVNRRSSFLVRVHPKIRRDLARRGQLDHVHRRRLASPSNAADLSNRRDVVRMACDQRSYFGPHFTRRFSAASRPLRSTISNSTCAPSTREL